MLTNEAIQSSLDYIEQNLKTTITTEELAQIAGYSVWHYCRLFSQATGWPVASYIGKRRLDRALSEIMGGRRAIDVALEYGFDTYAGFYKAFVRVYGSSPKNYVSMQEKEEMMPTEKELRRILENWDIPQDLPILDTYMQDGAKVSGNVWLIGEAYILKTADREGMLKNLRIAEALATQNFTASTPISTKTGAAYLDGEQITVLTRGIKGSPLAKEDRFGADRRAFGCKYGESIARLHRALAMIEPEIDPLAQNLFAHVCEWALPETKKQNTQYQLGLPDSCFTDYVNHFGVLFDALPKQLIHRDPNPSNILFDGGEVSGFIDFDLSHRNVRLFDPCYCATGILSEWREVDAIYEKWPAVLEGILHGYDRIMPLTDAEKKAVYYVILSIQMSSVAYCEPQEALRELAKTNREMLVYIVKNKDRIMAMFDHGDAPAS